MSAIWGYIILNALEDKESHIAAIESTMREGYDGLAIDRYSTETFEGGFFACGLQHFKAIAKKEVLPIYDRDKNIVFTADIVLNARKELMEAIAGAEGKGSTDYLENEPDGSLAYRAYLLWNKNFTDHIQGAFAIAVYDLENKIFNMFSDHMGIRAINYAVIGREIYFSTLPQVIYNVLPKDKRGISEKWIAGCESAPSPGMSFFAGLTPFENITQLVRGRRLMVYGEDASKDTLRKDTCEYWNPLRDMKPCDRKTAGDKDYYRNTFRKVYFDCIRDCLDTDGEIAVTLSSGLDSSSVATIAATSLAEKGKNLYSYTSVPLKDYKSNLSGDVITDESAGVKKICSRYSNIIPEFVSCDGKSAYTEAERLVRLSATPSKALSNEVWIDEINRLAAEKGCKFLLIGHYGNFTVSNGRVLARVYQELRAGHLKEAKRQLAAYGRRYGVTRKELLRGTMAQFGKELSFRLSLNKSYRDGFDHKYLKSELLNKYKILKIQKEMFIKEGYSELVLRKQASRLILEEIVAQDISISDTAASLKYGIITRDPTRDKRIVELMISLPPDQFTDDGLERRLIREYLDDFIPDEIRLEAFRRGRQGADLVLRLQRYGKLKISTDRNAPIYRYLDYENVQELIKEEINDKNAFDKIRVMTLDIFLNMFEG